MGHSLWRALSGSVLLALMAVVPVAQIVCLGAYLLAAGVLLPSGTSDARGASVSCAQEHGTNRDLTAGRARGQWPEDWDVPCR